METRNADIPFDPLSHAADVIIRSSDRVDFHVVKSLLTLSSPDIFGAMFSLPQAEENIRNQGNFQTVPVTEESRTLRTLFLSCYPKGFHDETSEDDDIAKAIVAARKYAMDFAEKVLMRTLLSHPLLVQKPLHMYALACRYKLGGLAQVAAKNTLRSPMSQLFPSPELDHISGMDMYRLLDYRAHCVREIWDWYFTTGIRCLFLENHPWYSDTKEFVWFDHSLSHRGSALDSPRQACAAVYSEVRTLDRWDIHPCDSDNYVTIYAIRWWSDYFIRLMREIQIIPSKETVFNDEIYYRAISEATACKTCRPLASEHLGKFRQLFAQALDRIVTEVCPRRLC